MRPWRRVHCSEHTIIWQRRDCDSVVVRLNKQSSSQWTGVSYFGNWHFPVPGWTVYYLGPFKSRTAAIRGAHEWMNENPDASYAECERTKAV